MAEKLLELQISSNRKWWPCKKGHMIMTYFFKILIILTLSFSPLFGEPLIQVTTGQLRLAESYIPIDLKDFEIISNSNGQKLDAHFISNSIQWIRNSGNLVTPRARLSLKIFDVDHSLHFKYDSTSYIPERHDEFSYTELYISLFNPSDIQIIKNKKIIGTIKIYGNPKIRKKSRHLVDLSCLRWGVETRGLENDYLSVGCEMNINGKIGEETPSLGLTLFATNFKLFDGSIPPFKAIMTSGHPVVINGIDNQGEKKTITIEAKKLPKRMYRLKTAWGFGPYPFRAQYKDLTNEIQIAPSVMLYARFDIDSKTSFRLFDAAVYRKSIFNNFGMYYAYELAEMIDNKIQVVPLLGFQSLVFQFDKNHALSHKLIIPQGGEILWRDFLGFKGYSAYFGIFKDLGMSEYDYINTWIRVGKRVFYEINYISWETQDVKSSMWGLSVGLPLGNFF